MGRPIYLFFILNRNLRTLRTTRSVVEKSPENAPTAKSIVPFSEKIKTGRFGIFD